MTVTDGAPATDESPDAITIALLTASRLLVAISAHSIAVVDETITIPQFRALVILSNRGPVNLTALAGTLGVQPSAVVSPPLSDRSACVRMHFALAADRWALPRGASRVPFSGFRPEGVAPIPTPPQPRCRPLTAWDGSHCPITNAPRVNRAADREARPDAEKEITNHEDCQGHSATGRLVPVPISDSNTSISAQARVALRESSGTTSGGSPATPGGPSSRWSSTTATATSSPRGGGVPPRGIATFFIGPT